MMRLPNGTRAAVAGTWLVSILAPGAMAHQAAHAGPPAHPAAQAPAATARSPTPHSSAPRPVAAASPPMHPAAAAPQSSAATRPARTVPVGSTPTHANASAYTAAANAPGWNTGWRGDTRYDWVGWRARHRTLFHPGFYYPPSGGYGYAPVGAGALLASAFLSEQYWIDDPSIYHLPPASDPYRWVRYYNDILLVDIDTGEVVDVVPDVFW